MNMPHEIAVVGIGSQHGDDCIGWRVIDEVDQGVEGVHCVKIRVPIDLERHE